MKYNSAISLSWLKLSELACQKNYTVRFLADRYSVDLKNSVITSLSSGDVVKEYISLLLLHYLIKQLQGLAPLEQEWISFKELSGGQGYYPVFQKRVIDVILKKISLDPQRLLGLVERFGARVAGIAEISVVLEPFESVPILITFWGSDQEFSAQANVLFDKSIGDIFCTEDVVVLAEAVAHSI